MDGRGDPYGTNKTFDRNEHAKALHLTPFVASVFSRFSSSRGSVEFFKYLTISMSKGNSSLLIAFCFLQMACGRRQSPPQAIFDQIRLTSLKGELSQARAEAEKASGSLPANDLAWQWKFRLLEAEILGKQGLSEQVLSLLNANLPPS